MTDVRAVALAHVRAITLDSMQLQNGRYLLSGGSLWFSEIIRCIKEEEKALGKKIKTRILGNWSLKIGAMFNPELKYLLPFLNQEILIDGSEASVSLGFEYTDIHKSIKEMAHAIVQLNK
jgi:dihydroflavonol-4-reductase